MWAGEAINASPGLRFKRLEVESSPPPPAASGEAVPHRGTTIKFPGASEAIGKIGRPASAPGISGNGIHKRRNEGERSI
jgi:hypothetical protein